MIIKGKINKKSCSFKTKSSLLKDFILKSNYNTMFSDEVYFLLEEYIKEYNYKIKTFLEFDNLILCEIE